MTAGQNAGQLHRANPSGMLVAVAAGAVAIGILGTLAVARPGAVTPAAAPVPVPPYEFRLDEKGITGPVSAPWSVPVPPYQFRLEERDISSTPVSAPWSVPVPPIDVRLGEHDLTIPATAVPFIPALQTAPSVTVPFIPALQTPATIAPVNKEAWARAQLAAAAAGSAIKSQEARARAQMVAANGAAASAIKSQEARARAQMIAAQ